MLQLENATVAQSGGGDKITMVLLGKSSKDKSTIGNIILKAERFIAGKETCTRAEEKLGDQMVCIINTPDLFHRPNQDQESDSIEEIKPQYPGPRAFLLVLHDKQLSQEEIDMFSQLKKRFGEKMVDNTIVVLVNSQKNYDQADENLKKLLDECGQRICIHNKKEDKTDDKLTKQVMEKWKAMHEKQASKSSDSTPADEPLYEDMDKYVPMKEIPEVSRVPKSSKEQTIQTYGAECMMTVILLGKSSKNKRFIGNTIFDRDLFESEKVTCEKIVGIVAGQKICIVNTPDLFHKPNLSDPEADRMEELKPSFAGPRVFLLILKNNMVSPKVMEMFTDLKKKLGQKMVENTIVLVNDEKKVSSSSIDGAVSFKNDYSIILNECGNRLCVYNKDIKNTDLIKELIKHIDSMPKKQTSESDRESPRTHANMETKQTTAITPVQVHQPKPMTIVLLGQTGSGKSATGNTILKKHHFESRASSLPVTQVCQMAEETVLDMKIRVIDTPDFFSEDLKNQEEQIKKCKELTQPGPDVYLLVMQLGRFTDGEREVLPHLKKEFGDDVTSKTVILFTGKEKLKNRSLNDYISGSDKELQELTKICHSRCHAFNNNDKSQHQVKKLLEIISDMKGFNAMANHYNHKKKHKENKGDCSIL